MHAPAFALAPASRDPHDRPMHYDWLEDFLALIECGGFSRAAEQRHLTQPTFSRRIRALEEWIGSPLVDRGTHRVRLTPAGEHFRGVAEDSLRRLRLGLAETRAAADAASDTLRFAATHVLSLTFFPPWLRGLERNSPLAAGVELIADTMAACEQKMVAGRVQFLLCHNHPSAPARLGPEFRSVRVGEDVLLPVIAPGAFAGAGGSAIPRLGFTEESGMGRILASARAAAGAAPPIRPVFTSHLASVLTAMARDGRGLAWTTRSLVADDLQTGVLVRADTPEPDVPIDIVLWRPHARQSRAAERLWARIDTRHEGMDRA